MNTIKVTIKNVYGTPVIYPVCNKATIFAEMLNQKTLTFSDIRHIKELGFTIEKTFEKQLGDL